MTVIATAGHVDHGKSTLVKALTGIDPDRWDEEKARGLTIDLGFANTVLPSGQPLSLVDVPGHVRFLRNMLAGVGSVDACLFVVAATEGWKPQSEEHLRILDLLGLQHGVIALTKVDQVDDDLLELAHLDVEEHVVGTFLAGAEVIDVAAIEHRGVDEVAAALDRLVAGDTAHREERTPRLWVDRSFAPAGVGTVVTGTLTGASLSVGDSLTVAGAGPDRPTVRIRGLQSHHRDLDRVGPANRVAVNLVGISRGDIARGDVLVEEDDWHFTTTVDAELTVLDRLDHAVSRRGAYAAYIGSGEFPVRLRVIGAGEIGPGERGPVRLHLPRPLPLVPGDRFILRESGRYETVGGGHILDVDPVLPASRARPDLSVQRVVAERGWVKAATLTRLTGQTVEPTIGDWVVDPTALAETTAEVTKVVEAAGALGLDLAGLDARQRAVVDDDDTFSVDNGRVTIGPRVDPLAGHPWIVELEAEPFSPPGPEGVDRGEVRELVRRGLVVEQDGVHFAPAAVEQARRLLRSRFEQQPDGLTVAEIRDMLGTTRKYVLALLSYLDNNGMTRRRGDFRIPGPRL
jgi:selenocysteine-specific elongation factor